MSRGAYRFGPESSIASLNFSLHDPEPVSRLAIAGRTSSHPFPEELTHSGGATLGRFTGLGFDPCI